MDECCDKRYRRRQQSRPGHRHRASHCLGAFLSLFALLAMLVSHVVHSVDIVSETAHPPATSGVTLHSFRAALPVTLSTATAGPPAQFHDPFLCAVCQLLSQSRHGLASTGLRMALPQRSITAAPGTALHHARPDLAASAPRAPPLLA
jgi:hypothetical protein